MMRLTPTFEETVPAQEAAVVTTGRTTAAKRLERLERLSAGRMPTKQAKGFWGESARPADRASIKLPLPAGDVWPPEVDLILSAMNAGGAGWIDQRRAHRVPYRVRAEFTLFADAGQSTILYCRDIDPNGVGFITTQPLPLGYGGTICVFTPAGQTFRIAATLTRCREAVSGWYEGALHFHQRQPVFAGDF